MEKKDNRNSHKTTSLLGMDDLQALNKYVGDGEKLDSEEQAERVEENIEEKSSKTNEQVEEVIAESEDSSTEPAKTIRSFNIPEGSLVIKDKEDKEVQEQKNANGPGKLTGFFGAAIFKQKAKVEIQKVKAAEKKAKKERSIKKSNKDDE